MIVAEYLAEMGAYNQWQNERLYSLCADLADDTRRADQGLFFGSIHGTLAHILEVDTALFGYAVDGERRMRPFGEVEFGVLRSEREALDERIAVFAPEVTSEWLAGRLDFWPDSRGNPRQISRALLLTQMFNHQTHHRSQVTAQLHRMGIDYGVTDIPFNPKRGY